MAERPNFGYDFGGYRDGIWLLEQLRQALRDWLAEAGDAGAAPGPGVD